MTLYDLKKHEKKPFDKHLITLILFDVQSKKQGWLNIAVRDYAVLKVLFGSDLIQAQDTGRHIII